jgi:hypothetical protein
LASSVFTEVFQSKPGKREPERAIDERIYDRIVPHPATVEESGG